MNKSLLRMLSSTLRRDRCLTPLHDLKERLLHALTQIFGHMMQECLTNVAVVTHGGVIMTLLSAFGFPQREMGAWSVDNGRGYTILLTPQMWMRDNRFEIYDTVPSALEEGDNRWDTRSFLMEVEE